MAADQRNDLGVNYLGYELKNYGMEHEFSNRGYGVLEAQGKAESIGPEEHKHKMRVSKAREFGKQQEEVGF